VTHFYDLMTAAQIAVVCTHLFLRTAVLLCSHKLCVRAFTDY